MENYNFDEITAKIPIVIKIKQKSICSTPNPNKFYSLRFMYIDEIINYFKYYVNDEYVNKLECFKFNYINERDPKKAIRLKYNTNTNLLEIYGFKNIKLKFIMYQQSIYNLVSLGYIRVSI